MRRRGAMVVMTIPALPVAAAHGTRALKKQVGVTLAGAKATPAIALRLPIYLLFMALILIYMPPARRRRKPV